MSINYSLELSKLGLTGGIQKPGKSDIFFHCCFHENDKTPSLSINIENGLYRCFSCGKTGNFFTLVRHLKGDEYYYEHYGTKADFSFKPKTFEMDENYRKEVDESVLLKYRQLHSWVLNRFDNDAELLKSFEIGYDSNREAITLPIRDIDGKLYNVEFRHLKGQTKSSYLYDFNKKGKVLFNLHKVKNESKVYLVEGIFDAIRMTQLGYPNVLALMGTELTPERISILNNYFSTLYLAFDSDLAGKKISKQIFEEFKDSKEMYYLDWGIVGKKDPGECTKEEIDAIVSTKKLIV